MIYQGLKQRFDLAMDQRLADMSNAQSADDFMEAYPLEKNECQKNTGKRNLFICQLNWDLYQFRVVKIFPLLSQLPLRHQVPGIDPKNRSANHLAG